MGMDRNGLGRLIADRIKSMNGELSEQFQMEGRIPSCYLDDLLPQEAADEVYRAFPKSSEMIPRHTFREKKHVSAQLNAHDPLIEEVTYAFQQPDVLKAIEEVTGITSMFPDEQLYAGGLLLMEQGDHVNPHLDNSHDHDRKMYRVVNLLYYVTPDWQAGYGGHLELWDQGVKRPPRVIHSRFNRLVVMATGKHSWHSVSEVLAPVDRRCIANFYFSPTSDEGQEYFHVSSFRARSSQPFRDLLLRGDTTIRMGVRKVLKRGLVRTKHIYAKP